MIMGCLSQLVVETLKYEPIIHPMVRTCQDVLLKLLPRFRNGLIGRLLKTQNSPSLGIGFAHWEELREEHVGAIVPGIY